MTNKELKAPVDTVLKLRLSRLSLVTIQKDSEAKRNRLNDEITMLDMVIKQTKQNGQTRHDNG